MVFVSRRLRPPFLSQALTFSGAPNLCARFKQSLALRSKFAEKSFPVLPDKISTLHGIQGKTADPGLAAHWKFPKNLSPEALWLAHYVILSRPRTLANLLSFGLPSRKILEAGPPKAITEAFQRVFGDKIGKTKEACAEARRELGWPARIA